MGKDPSDVCAKVRECNFLWEDFPFSVEQSAVNILSTRELFYKQFCHHDWVVQNILEGTDCLSAKKKPSVGLEDSDWV